jgi:hypothetical protein
MIDDDTNLIPERMHRPATRFLRNSGPSLRDDIAEIIADHSKGCLIGPAGACPECTLAALHAVELRLMIEDAQHE